MKEMIKRQLAFIVMIAMLVSMLPTSMLPTAVASAEDGEGGPIVIQSDPLELNEGGDGEGGDGPIVFGPLGGDMYEVTFLSKDATGVYVEYDKQEVLEGQKPIIPAVNPIDTYAQIFDGWDSNATAVVTGDIDVYAKYRDRKTLIYAVEFYMQDGTGAGVNTIYAAELEGKTINRTIEVPEIAGYTPQAAGAVAGFTLKAGGTYYQVVINDANISAEKTFRINYVPNGNTNYTVRHWQQTVTGGAAYNSSNYTLVSADTQTLQGPTGSNVAPVAKSYTGFTIDTDISNIKSSIKADGSTVVDLYYTRNEYSVYFDLGGGTLPTTQPNPMVVRYDAPLNVSTITPSRLGYNNAATKWTLQGGGTIPAKMPNKDIVLVAGWTPKTATYKIALWAQNADDDDYTLYGTITQTALTVESTIPLTSITLPTTAAYTELRTYFTYDAAKTNEKTYKVAGDGSTIVDAYYSRKTYTMTFTQATGLTMRVYRLADGTVTTIQPTSGTYTTLEYTTSTSPKYSITVRYNQSLQTVWPTAGNYSGAGNTMKFTGWTPSSGGSNWASMRVTFTADMTSETAVTAQTASSVTYQYLHYRIESINQSAGTGRVYYSYNGTSLYYENDPEISQYLYNNSTNWSAKNLTGVTQVNDSGVSLSTSDPLYVSYGPDGTTKVDSNTAFYYSRNSYYIDFNNGSDATVTKGPVKYGFPITSYNYTPGVPSNLAGLGYTFDGWFTSKNFEENTRFNWSSGMTPRNLVLYAKWVAPTYKVTFNANGGTPNPATQTVTSGNTITTPSPMPTYYKHDFVGWYYEQGGSQVRFLETQEVYRNYDLVARWTGDDTVDVTVKYVKDADSSQLTANETVQGQLGETLTIPAKGFPDYMPTVPSQDIKLTDIYGHTVTFRYVTAQVVTYKVKYLDKATNQPVAPEKIVTYTPSSGVVPEAKETRLLVPGYTADAYQKSILLVPDPAFNEIVFFYDKQSNDTSYKVVHHFENANTAGYTAEAGAGSPIAAYTGQVVSAAALTRTGFTYDASLSNASGTVLPDGSLTLNLYYKRTRHSYVVNYVSAQTGILDTVTRNQIKYGASVTETKQDFAGNVYIGFVVGAQTGTGNSATATITNNATVFTFNYNTMYTITATAVNGTITPASRSVEHGKNASFTYSPNTYYELDKVLVDGVVVSHTDPSTYTFTNVTKGHTLEVQFKKKQFPLTVTAQQQKYVYSTLAQGFFGDTIATQYVTVSGLQSGHTAKSVTLTGSQKINAGTYPAEIKPTTVVIQDAQGNDASGFYVITRNNADLVIDKKGDGTDPSGNQIPIKVAAAPQTYVYNGQLQGEVGLQNISAGNPLASATGLIGSHALTQVTIDGNKKRDVGTYTGELKPTKAVIMDGATNVTDNYLIEASSYIAGTLQITAIGSDGKVTITAKKQEYTYSGAAQGHFGVGLAVTAGDPYVEANGLLPGHELRFITLKDVSTGAQNLTDVGTYSKVVQPMTAVIIDTTNGNADVTKNYVLTYVNGDIVINKKGNGNGPLDITATRQVFTYNGAAQGTFGSNITINQTKPQATVVGLLPEHQLQVVTLTRNPGQTPAIDAGTYAGHIVPSAVRIVEKLNTSKDVTSNYWIDDATSYHNGDLLINPKGNGTVDPLDPDGREYPLDITAILQEYVYNGLFQGDIGPKTTRATAEAVLTADTKAQLLSGQYFTDVTINTLNNEGQKREPALYSNYLIPAAAKISNGTKDVTANYRIETSSYHAGNLLIKKKGSNTDNDKPIAVTARAQTFIYTSQPQGYVGTNLANQDASYGTALVSSADLATGHYIKLVDINVPKKTDVGTYTNYLTPTNAKIYAMQNSVEVDVTANYVLDGTSYKPGTLKIDTNANAKVQIIAKDQTYTYDGTAQGVVGAQTIAYQTQAGRDAAYVYATGLYEGHYLASATIGGSKQTNAGTYPLKPSTAKIVDINGNDVGSNYDVSKIEYVDGTLRINPKGNGIVDPVDPYGREYPLDIYAQVQEYIYNGAARGDFGEKEATTGATALLKATGVVTGQKLYAVLSADGAQGTAIDAATYPKYIIPGSARIMSGSTNVTANYRIEASSYNPADLIIHKKGSGTPDPDGGETPLQIFAKKQSYVYDATLKGDIGAKTGTAGNQTAINAVIDKTVTLVPGQYISDITILTKNNEGQKKDPGTYTDHLIPSGVVIRNASGADVTKNYRIDATTYIAADLFIDKRGDPTDNSKVITVTARDQSYIYSGQPQGIVGTAIDVATRQYNGTDVVFAAAGHLANGHKIKTIDINVPQKTDVGLYTGHLVPTKVVIIDTLDGNRVVTDFYKIDGNTYKNGTLEIKKKGQDGDNDKAITVTAQTQTYLYDGTAKGQFGSFTGLTKAQMDVYAKALGLNAGHTLVDITLADVSGLAAMIDAKTYSKVIRPSAMKIVDAGGNNVTGNYLIDATTYIDGDLIIKPRGIGPDDAQPIKVTALEQRFIYNDTPQGYIGAGQAIVTGGQTLASAVGLLQDHELRTVDISGTKQTLPDTYTNVLTPYGVMIWDKVKNVQVPNSNYVITSASYVPGNLVIEKKGSNTDNDLPITVTAVDQQYEYDNTAKGNFGSNKPVDPSAPIVLVPDLVAGHYAYTVTLSGTQMVAPGEYLNHITPSALVIRKGNPNSPQATDPIMTDYYKLTAASYIKGKLVITPKGGASLIVTANDQKFVYDGTAKGYLGTRTTDAKDLVSVQGLYSGHYVAQAEITLTDPSMNRTDPGKHQNALNAGKLVIKNALAGDAVVTGYYNLVDATYNKGTLIINPKGNGDPDPGDPDGGEYPLTITANDQSFVYNAAARGHLGAGLTVDDPQYSVVLAAVQKGLLPGHKLKSITLSYNSGYTGRTDVGSGALVPTAAVIVDGAGVPVTDKYNIQNTSYNNGTLSVTQKAVTVTLLPQTYTYNAAAQGKVGLVTRGADAIDTYATVTGVADAGHLLQTVTILGSQQTNPGDYTLTPSAATIRGAVDVTANYQITYVAGPLKINKKGNGSEPILVEAKKQIYVYNAAPQGNVGKNLTASAVVTVTGILPVHEAYLVDIDVAKKTDAGTYTNYLTPSNIRIRDISSQVDVTAYYDIDQYTPAQLAAGNLAANKTYKPATLLINPKGDGTPVDPLDPEKGENPFKVTAVRQAYVYSGAAQGEVGTITASARIAALTTTDTLISGHTIKSVDISDATAKRTDPNLDGSGNAIDYVDLLVPKNIQIVSGSVNVTKNYKIAYVKGNLFIDKKGSGGNNSDPIVVKAIDQTYGYDGLPHGIVGPIPDVSLAQYKHDGLPVATSAHLASGQRIKAITINASQETAAAVYPDVLQPSGVSIVNATGVDVTKFYKIDPIQTYKPGTLTIDQAGSNVTITLKPQTYTYNGAARGQVGSTTIIAGTSPYVAATGLQSGERLAWVNINQTQRTIPGTYTLAIPASVNGGTPGSTQHVKIINSSNVDVTGNYDVTKFKLVASTMTIKKRPITITVRPQTYKYDSTPQGVAGGTFNVNTGLSYPTVLATAQAMGTDVGLVTGQTFSTITLGGAKQTNVGSITLPGKSVVILDGATPVQAYYDIKFVDSKLTITPIGDGPSGNDPITVRANHQVYNYNAKPQGRFGTFTNPQSSGLAQVDNNVLLSNHRLSLVTISGPSATQTQETNVGTYTNRLVPSAAVIRDINTGADVTANYIVTAASYKKGNLVIQPAATPVQLVAKKQTYVYNAQPQGEVGAISIAANDTAPLVTTAQPLLQGHRLSKVYLNGSQRTNAGTYSNALTPRTAGTIIVDSQGNNVTDNYAFAATHVSADLVINPKGNGEDDGNGGEKPMNVWAQKQDYVYNAKPQGKFGNLTYSEALAKIIGLLPGHSVTTITLSGTQQILPALYANAIEPTGVVIKDAAGVDVTANYLLTPASYRKADLEIHKKGDGTPDGNGGENPLKISTPDQVYVYDGQPHGNFGVNLPVGTGNPLASAIQLLPGHEIEYITLVGTQQVNANTYVGAITPANIRIIDSATRADETANYNIVRSSYIPADLIIRQRGRDGDPTKPMKVTVFDETYIYNGQLQGSYGEVAIPQAGSTEPAKARLDSGTNGLVAGHTFTAVIIADNRQLHAGVYPKALMPTAVRILDAAGVDVTANYFFNDASWIGGKLTINKRARINNDGQEVPILIVAEDQTYYYNGRAQGITGKDLRAEGSRIPLVYTDGLLDGDYVFEIDISGKRQAAVGEYPDTFMPSNAMLLNEFGENVTGDYLMTEENTYFAGALIILEAENVLGVFDLDGEYFGITSRDVGDLVE